MRCWEIEIECDDSWSANGIYSFFIKQDTEPNEDDFNRVQGMYPNTNGLGNIVRITDVTDYIDSIDGIGNL